MFAASLDSQSDFRALGLHTKVTMRPGRDMSLMSRSDTKDYLIRLEGWADVSHKDADGNYLPETYKLDMLRVRFMAPSSLTTTRTNGSASRRNGAT